MKKNKGFTLIELLVVLAILGVLSAIILALLTNARNKGNDSKVQVQLKNMMAQAQLFSGTTGAGSFVVSGTLPTPTTITGAADGGTSPGYLFNDTGVTVKTNSLYNLLSKLPTGTDLYYGWDGVSPLNGGKWFVAAEMSNGAYCVDYSSASKLKAWAATPSNPPIVTDFTAAGVFPNATAANGYSCS